MKKLLKPFDYIAGWRAMLWGLVILVLTIVFSWRTGIVARGNFSVGYADGEPTFAAIAVRMLIIWLLFATLLYVAGVLFSKSKIRAVDVYGTNLLAQIPLTISMLLSALPVMRNMGDSMRDAGMDAEKISALLNTPAMIFMLIFLLFTMVWYFYWSYYAFSVSANMKGGKAVAIYAACFIIAQICLGPISRALLHLGLA